MQRLSFLLLLLSVFFVSCNSDGFVEHDLGSNLIDNSTDVRLIDTFTINASTIILDSIATSGSGVMSVGRYVDPYLGIVSAQSYTKIGLGGTFKLESSNNPVYDSLVLVTYYDENYYGDTTKMQTVSVHKVTEEIKLDDSGKFYNVSSFDIDPEPLGELTFRPRPFRTEEDGSKYNLRIPLSDELGQELINKAIDHDDILSGSNEWQDYFEGISLVPGDSDDASVLNFKTADTLNIRLYYHETSGNNTDKVLHHNFPAGSSAFVFSNYKSDRTGTSIENLKEQEFDISSKLTNDLTFIQGGIGLMTRIEIPYLDELAKVGLSGSLLKAELIFYPTSDTYDDDIFRLPSSFNLFRSNKKNDLLGTITNSLNGNAITANFVEDVEYQEGSYYSFDITSYVNSLLQAGETLDEDNGLLISIPTGNLSNSLDRIVLTNDDKNDLEFKLKATYVVQKQ